MRKKLTFLLLSLLMCVVAMADQIVGKYTLNNSTQADCWVSQAGIIYAINTATEETTMEVWGLSSAGDNYSDPNVIGDNVPIWDGTAENIEVEILDYVGNQYVTNIESSIFNGEQNIVTVILPSTIESIGNTAFSNCKGLKDIYCYAETPPTLGTNVFGSLYSNLVEGVTLHVPYGCSEAYKNDSYKKDGAYQNQKGWGDYCEFTVTSTSSSTYGLTAGPTFTSVVEMEQGATGPTTSGSLTVDPADGSRVQGKLESIIVSSTEGALSLYAEANFPILIYSTGDNTEAVASFMYEVDSADEDAGTFTLYVYDATGTTKQALDTYGDFSFTVPENTFTIGEGTDKGNIALTFYYTIEDDAVYEITINPADNTSTDQSISDFTVSCTDGLAVVITPNTFSQEIFVYKNGTITDNYILEDDEESTDISHTFYFNTALSAAGTYTVTFPAGTFRVGPNNQLSQEMTITYIITTDAEEYSEIVWSPDNTSALNELSEITIYNYLDDQRGTSRIKIADDTKISITDEDGNSYTFTATDGTNNSYVTITLEESINAKGTYTLTAEEGAFKLGTTETDNEEIVIAYDIANYDITFTPDGTSSMRSLATFTINCTDGIILNPNDDEGYDNLTITKDGDTEIYAQVVPDPTPAADGSYTFTIYDADGETATPLTEDGEYVVGVPKNYFSLGTEQIANAATTCTYIISGDANIDTFTYDPKDGATVEQLDVISITNGEDGLTINCEDPSVIVVTNEAGDIITTCKEIKEVYEEGVENLDTEIQLILNDEIEEAGTYKVVIPSGIIFYGTTSTSNDKITLTYTVEPPTPLFSTQFTNWYDLSQEDSQEKVIPVITSTMGNFTFTLNGVSVDKDDVSQWNTDDEGNKTSAKFEGEGALIFGKASSTDDVYYVETSALGSVDKIKFTEAVTGSNRGAKVLVKGDGDTDWETLYDTTMNTGSQEVKVNVNRTNCQVRFENLAYNQNVYILDLKIYGTDGEELTFDTALEIDPVTESELDSLASFTISYADGIELDDSSLQGYVVNEKGASMAIFDFTKTSDATKGVQTSYTFTLYDISDPEKAAALTADGTYTISIDEGTFRLGIYDESIANDDKETTEPIEITYIIGTGISAKTEDFVLTPENGATELTQLSDFTASCEAGIALTDEDIALEVTVGKTVVAIAKYAEGDEITDADGTIGYNIKFYDPETGEAITLTEEATYSFTIPAGTFVYGSDDTKNEEIVMYYTIGELWFTFVPSDGSTVSSLESISVTNGLEGVGVRYVPNPLDPRETATGLIVVLDEKKDTVATVPNYDDYVVEIWDENNPDEPDTEVIFNFDRPINTAGTYTVIIPANIIFQGKRDIDSTGDIELTITVDGTADDDTYQLYIELDDGALGDNSSLEDVWATIQEDYPESVEALQETYDEISAEISALRVDLLASYKAGTIEDDALEFEAQITEIQTKINALLETASGIDGITTDATSFEGKGVYTISGQKVAAPTKAGIYIIDGKKVVIK